MYSNPVPLIIAFGLLPHQPHCSLPQWDRSPHTPQHPIFTLLPHLIHTRTHKRTHTHTHIDTHAYTCAHTHAHKSTHACTCTHTHTCTDTCILCTFTYIYPASASCCECVLRRSGTCSSFCCGHRVHKQAAPVSSESHSHALRVCSAGWSLSMPSAM